MGLMYIFPVSDSETERSEIKINQKDNQKTIILKTYGLPMIFWAYLACAFVVLFSMWLAAHTTLAKLIQYDDPTLKGLGFLVYATLILTPVILLGFFFYEKYIVKTGKKIKLIYRVFFIPFYSKTIMLESPDSLLVEHFMDSPNMAKIYNKDELRGFENKGFFELKALSNGQKILIDRHTRKADLIKIKELLSKY